MLCCVSEHALSLWVHSTAFFFFPVGTGPSAIFLRLQSNGSVLSSLHIPPLFFVTRAAVLGPAHTISSGERRHAAYGGAVPGGIFFASVAERARGADEGRRGIAAPRRLGTNFIESLVGASWPPSEVEETCYKVYRHCV